MVKDVNGTGVEVSQEEGGTTGIINIDCQVSDAAEFENIHYDASESDNLPLSPPTSSSFIHRPQFPYTHMTTLKVLYLCYLWYV